MPICDSHSYLKHEQEIHKKIEKISEFLGFSAFFFAFESSCDYMHSNRSFLYNNRVNATATQNPINICRGVSKRLIWTNISIIYFKRLLNKN